VDFIADSDRNPFGLDPPCDVFVPGYGATAADFHIVGDHPGVHGGRESGIPFTDRPWSSAFFDALRRGGLVGDVDLGAGRVVVPETYLSYIHTCDPGDESPTDAEYAALEPFFDAELRAITADVLLPVGPRATAHVLGNYTTQPATDLDMDRLHATELQGSGWLVVPIADPAEWHDAHADRLADGLAALRARDYRRVADLGRFMPDDEPYFVR
jgi:uracil-DNA glycosylase